MLNNRIDSVQGIHYWSNPSVSSWLRAISKARFVVTDSYHGMLFSIIFRRQFAIIPAHKKRFVRIGEFLESLGLEKRVCWDCEDLYKNDWDSMTIDFDYIFANIIKSRREESMAFLKSALAAPIE